MEAATSGKAFSRIHLVMRVMQARPVTWADCVRLARLKFEKYFNHKARQLLTSFPPDATLTDGSPFWLPPKRQPVPVIFSMHDPLHMAFVHSGAMLFAYTYGITPPEHDNLAEVLAGVVVPPFEPKSKKIVTDESVKRTDAAAAAASAQLSDDQEAFPIYATLLRAAFDKAQVRNIYIHVYVCVCVRERVSESE